MASLTAHIMIRNEPFVRYAVLSVYPFVDSIFLWDTGSTDAFTLIDVSKLVMHDDPDLKIHVKFLQVDVDETKWTTKNWHRLRVASTGRYTKGVVRQEMIAATSTDWFMIVDGDEVHYPQTMQAVRAKIETAPKNVLCYGLPLLWLNTPKTYFRRSTSGRVFRTDGVDIITKSPNEMHTDKRTGAPLCTGNPGRRNLRVKPYAHFETYLKPWRRSVDRRDVRPYSWALPTVMVTEPEIAKRFAERLTHVAS